MVAAQFAARLRLFHELLQVLWAADAVLFADVKQRDPAREVLRHGGLFFFGSKVAGLFPRCKAVCTLGFIDAQPLAHGGVADADALRRSLAADLACFDFFHKRDLLLWRQLWSLGHGEHLKRVRSEEIGVKGVKAYRGVGAGHCGVVSVEQTTARASLLANWRRSLCAAKRPARSFAVIAALPLVRRGGIYLSRARFL